MISGGRPLTEYELEASKEYDRLINEKIPGTNRRYCDYYMPSILEHFPHIKAAFDHSVKVSQQVRLIERLKQNAM